MLTDTGQHHSHGHDTPVRAAETFDQPAPAMSRAQDKQASEMMKPRIQEIATALRVIDLAGKPYGAAALVVFLGLAAAVFEGIGLSFLIPLVAFATGTEANLAIPVIGPVLAQLDAWIGLSATNVVLFVVAFFFLGIVVGYLNMVVSTIVTMRVSHALRMRVFETVLTRPIALIESAPSGKFFNDLATETWHVCDAFLVVVRFVIQAITFLVLLGFLVAISPFYTLILLGMTAAMAIVVHLATRQVRGLGQSAVAANQAFMAYIWDTLAGLRVIRGFGHEAHEWTRFEDRSQRIRHVFTRLRILSGVVSPITQMMTVGMIALILGVAVYRGDPLSLLIGYLAIAYRMQPRVTALLGARTTLRGLEASVRSIEEALALHGTPDTGTRDFAGLRDGIAFDRVSVRYPKADKPSLHDVSCSFSCGNITAVAGYSGAGKTTLVALLLRFLEPEQGQVLVDGVPLREIRPESWHRRIAFVEQNAFLFNASVRDNIGYSDLDADFDAIREAARLAQAEDFILELPQGYDTPIGEDGIRLSQGQRQRIALARALLRKPDVLVLDEATNALDRPTEEALRMAVGRAHRVRVVIVIAHRRETIETADQVIVIDQGRVAEAGTPDELARAGGIYARLYLDAIPAGD